VYDFVLRLARRRVAEIGTTAAAEAAGIDKAQLSRWLSSNSSHRELRADAFCRLADSLGVVFSWAGWPKERSKS
jgi:transcriptional regulator with XRE-family HTH domain